MRITTLVMITLLVPKLDNSCVRLTVYETVSLLKPNFASIDIKCGNRFLKLL